MAMMNPIRSMRQHRHAAQVSAAGLVCVQAILSRRTQDAK
jgi:hypothetical protein